MLQRRTHCSVTFFLTLLINLAFCILNPQAMANPPVAELQAQAVIAEISGSAHLFEPRKTLPTGNYSRKGEEVNVAGRPMNKLELKKSTQVFEGDVIETEEDSLVTFSFPTGDVWEVQGNSRIEFAAPGAALTVLLGRVTFVSSSSDRSTTVVKAGLRYFRNHFAGDFIQIDSLGNVANGSDLAHSNPPQNTPITSKQLIDADGKVIQQLERQPPPSYTELPPNTEKLQQMHLVKLAVGKVITYRSDKLLGKGWPIQGHILHWIWPWGAVDAAGDIFPFVKSSDAKGVQTYARWNWSAGLRLSSVDTQPFRFYLTPQIGAAKVKGVFNVGETRNGSPVTSAFGGNPRAFFGFKLGASFAMSETILDSHLNYMLRYSSDRVAQHFYFLQADIDTPIVYLAENGVVLIGLLFRYEDFEWSQSFGSENSRSLSLNWTQFGIGASWRH